METATKTNPIDRELTPTECKIAIAQIEDRLTRVCKAQNEMHDFDEDPEGKAINSDDKEAVDAHMAKWDTERDLKSVELRKKYDIPNGVHLFDAEEGSAYYTAKSITPHIAAFVKGQMTEESYSDMWFFLEECFEVDYGWVFIERPMGFYGAGRGQDIDIDEIQAELRSIATRSRKKNTRLPVIAEHWSSMFQLASPEDKSDPSTELINNQLRPSAPIRMTKPAPLRLRADDVDKILPLYEREKA